ncbi:MULE transposase domain containing protein [Nitzschia inconspicua]|uniref:MULE transposase domain containing protein n=1 Tax=Nitzschia inconspicua TaxID=303405 RepID=A0A9K3LMH1_9STRA|nr:MULE transposase domain containing protein [Nitzschia inconspicua]
MDKIYPIAFAITADNENGQGWDWVLRNLDAGLPNLTIAHYRVGCAYKLFLLQSDRQKGLDEACKACFPANHHCYCAVHIRRNVEGRHGKKIGHRPKAMDGLCLAVGRHIASPVRGSELQHF